MVVAAFCSDFSWHARSHYIFSWTRYFFSRSEHQIKFHEILQRLFLLNQVFYFVFDFGFCVGRVSWLFFCQNLN